MIEYTINEIVSNLTPSDGPDLKGMEFDIYNSFDDTLNVISQELTNNPHYMIVVNLEVTDDVKHLMDIASSLKIFWNNVQYHYFEASTIDKHIKIEWFYSLLP